MASLVIYNAKIYVEKGHFEEALWAEEGIIRAVGSNSSILASAPKEAKRYDAQGRTVVPGFNDSHQHLLNVGENLSNIQLLGASSIQEVKHRVQDFIEKKSSGSRNRASRHGLESGLLYGCPQAALPPGPG